jgi:hypothetical protein
MASSSTPANTAIHVGITVLILGTAFIHFSINFPHPVFIMNGLGYLALLAALYLPIPQIARYRNLVPWVLIGYTALTIFLWILFGERNIIGYADKAIEVALITLLLLYARGSRF